MFSKCLLNAVNEGAEVTLVGSLYHACAIATQNKQSPITWSQVRGMIGRLQEPERRRCSASASLIQHSKIPIYTVSQKKFPPLNSPNFV